MLPLLRGIFSKPNPPHAQPNDTGLETRIRRIEANQKEILNLLRGMADEAVPRSDTGIYRIGSKRTVLYLNDLLPQIYLTLVSVLQGAVLAILIDQFTYDYKDSFPVFYLYFAASLLIIIAFWYAYLAAVFDRQWPFSIIDTILFFVSASIQAVAVKYVSDPHLWCFSMGIMCLAVAVVYLRQWQIIRHLRLENIFEDVNFALRRGRIVLIYCLFFLLAAVIAFLFSAVTFSDPAHLAAGILAVALSSMFILLSIRGRRNLLPEQALNNQQRNPVNAPTR